METINRKNKQIKLTNRRVKDFYRFILEKYICPLLGIDDNSIKTDLKFKRLKEKTDTNKSKIIYDESTGTLYIYIYFSDIEKPDNANGLKSYKLLFSLTTKMYFAKGERSETLMVANKVLRKFIPGTCDYNLENFLYCLLTLNVDQFCYADLKTLDAIYEDTLIKWVGGKIDAFPKLMRTLENISLDLYEGKNVNLSLLISTKSKANKKNSFDYINFLEKEHYSLVLTDETTSGVILDRNGYFVSTVDYKTEREKSKYKNEQKNQGWFYPRDFEDICCCTGKLDDKNYQLAVILRTNGEILVFKEGRIKMARINGKWHIANDYALKSLLTNEDKEFTEKNFEEIYNTLLDVSFNHDGGCLTIINNPNDTNFLNLIKETDLFSNENEMDDKHNKIKEMIESSSADKDCNFYKINRNFRSELMGLDGATLIDKKGNLLSTSAIIKIDDTASGGGARSASAKTLSEYGIAIKVSMDGSITVYDQGELVLTLF